MNNINIGSKIRELRKKKGITQEALASVLSVSPQAVSKWESGLTYPDMETIPIIAGYFEVSMDILFDYDLREMKSRIKNIIDNAREYFFSNTQRYIGTIKAALQEYPGNEELMTALLDAYEHSLCGQGDLSHIDEMIEISQKIILESADFVRVCNAKEIQAAAYLQKDEYQKAKSVLETLPTQYSIRDGACAYRLSGKDKLGSAVLSKHYHLQWLYRVCMEEGNAWFYMDRHSEVDINDCPSGNHIAEALKCYQKGLRVLTTFILSDIYDDPTDQYLWAGMQTFHWGFHQCIAACHKKLGNIDECEKSIAEAYRLVSVTWKDFDQRKTYYMDPFYEYLREYGLEEYIR